MLYFQFNCVNKTVRLYRVLFSDMPGNAFTRQLLIEKNMSSNFKMVKNGFTLFLNIHAKFLQLLYNCFVYSLTKPFISLASVIMLQNTHLNINHTFIYVKTVKPIGKSSTLQYTANWHILTRAIWRNKVDFLTFF